jgi:ubiquinone biosynthesis protein
VHAAELPDGTEVVVKVLRPGVREKIEQDLEVMRTIAALASRYWEHGERLKPLEVVAEYEQTIIDELDLMREAGNAAQLKRNFEGSEMLYVPEIYWDFCRPAPTSRSSRKTAWRSFSPRFSGTTSSMRTCIPGISS